MCLVFFIETVKHILLDYDIIVTQQRVLLQSCYIKIQLDVCLLALTEDIVTFGVTDRFNGQKASMHHSTTHEHFFTSIIIKARVCIYRDWTEQWKCCRYSTHFCINMVSNHLLPPIQPQSSLQWISTSLEESLAEFYTIHLEENLQFFHTDCHSIQSLMHWREHCRV
jgi:hypothetical protein